MAYIEMERILITGVSSGTGLGLTKAFVDAGYQVIGSVRSRDKADELRSRFGDSFVPLVFDVTNPDQIASAAERLRHQHGVNHLSAIVNNAGAARIGPLLHVRAEEFTQHLDVLVIGQLSVIQNFYEFLLPGDRGHETGKIFNITSVSGVGTNYLFGCYAAGKHALEGLSKTLRQECAMYGIKVVVVAPGNISTAIWDKQTDDIINRYRDTDYFGALKKRMNHIESDVLKQAMSVEEFSEAFLSVFKDAHTANRYTVIKSKMRRNPFSRPKVRILRS